VHQEELDRREVLVQQLQAQNDDLTSTVEMLKEELISTSAEAERASSELDNMRSRAFEESAQENLVRERELRETQTELERCRMEKEEWERMAMQDKVVADEARSNAEMYRRDLELEREARERDAAELESEREKSENLQSVLQDFQAGERPLVSFFFGPNASTAKDHELRQAVKDYNSQLTQVTQSLAEYKHRALTAEVFHISFKSMLRRFSWVRSFSWKIPRRIHRGRMSSKKKSRKRLYSLKNCGMKVP
jgi:outer membrane murein-binding lipoprotein Lpp